MKGTLHTLSLNMYVTLHNPNFSVLLSYLFFIFAFFFDSTFLCCLSWLISVINKPQPNLCSGGHLNSRDTCLGPKDVPWIEVPLYSYHNIVLYTCMLTDQYCIIYTCMFTDQYCTKYTCIFTNQYWRIYTCMFTDQYWRETIAPCIFQVNKTNKETLA